MNLQEIFNKVATHLLTQKAKAEEGITCLLRDSKGRSCAIGCLISDNDYRPFLENIVFEELYVCRDVLDGGYDVLLKAIEKTIDGKLNECKFNLLMSLQYIHDEYDVGQWRRMLVECAKEHSLKMVVIKRKRI